MSYTRQTWEDFVTLIDGAKMNHIEDGIYQNAEDITSNAKDISTNKESITSNTSQIEKNTENISKNTSDIADLNTSLAVSTQTISNPGDNDNMTVSSWNVKVRSIANIKILIINSNVNLAEASSVYSIFTLPSSCLPTEALYTTIMNQNGAPIIVQIATDGTVSVRPTSGTANGWVRTTITYI